MKQRALALALALALLSLCGGCGVVTYSLEEPYRPAEPLSPEVRERFAYDVTEPVALAPGWVEVDAVVRLGRLMVRSADDAEPRLVEFEYWRSHHASPRAPVIVITPILGGGEEIATTQCRTLTAAGLHAVLVERGTRMMRRSWPIRNIEDELRRSVAERRAVIDWLVTRPEIDPRAIGAFGISMGGIVSTLLTAVEPRIHSAVLALGGVDIPAIIGDSSEHQLIRYREAKAEQRGVDQVAVEELIRDAVVSDPLAVARAIDPRQVLQVTARFDSVVPLAYQERLWEALGRPLRYDIPTGHYTGILFLPGLTRVAARWYHRRFAGTPEPAAR